MKIKQLKLRIRNSRGTVFDARKIDVLKGRIPRDSDILARYVLYREKKIPEFYPFRIKLEGLEKSASFLKTIQEERIRPSYDMMIDGVTVCKIDVFAKG